MCGGESQGRDLSRFFSLSPSLSLQIMYPRHTLPYLTLPDLTLPYRCYLCYLCVPIETRSIPKKPLYPNSNSTRSTRSRSLGGADKPSSKGSVVPPKYLGSLFKKDTMHDSTYLEVRYLLPGKIVSAFSSDLVARSMQRCI